MKRIILIILIVSTLGLSYFITLQGIWTPPNPPWHAKLLVTLLVFGIISGLTTIPYYTFVFRK
jgi:CHASE2 domain-containing sensor protein